MKIKFWCKHGGVEISEVVDIEDPMHTIGSLPMAIKGALYNWLLDLPRGWDWVTDND